VDEGRTPPAPIKVVDRRRFTDDGTLREGTDREREAAPVPRAAPAAEDRPPEAVPSRGPAPEAPPPTSSRFVELVAMLAQQAELLLTGAEGIPRDPVGARIFIDYLGVLEEKSRGNLTAEEARILSSILFELRSTVIQGRR